MNLDDLHLAVVVAREGSLSAAAAQLGSSVATLSKAVARLERATKVRLFERLARGMRPTEFGQTFLQRAERIDLDAADLHAALRDLRQARAGSLRVGLGLGVPDRWVQAMAVPLALQGVQLELRGGMTDDLARAVRTGSLEFAVIGLKRGPGQDMHWQALKPDPMQPVAPDSHPLVTRGSSCSWQALSQAPWILTARGTATYAEFESNFAAQGLPSPRAVVLSNSSHRERLLAHALGAVMLLPQSVVTAPQVAGGPRLVPLHPTGGWRSDRHLGIVRRSGAYLSPAADQAIRLLQDACAAEADATAGPRTARSRAGAPSSATLGPAPSLPAQRPGRRRPVPAGGHRG